MLKLACFVKFTFKLLLVGEKTNIDQVKLQTYINRRIKIVFNDASKFQSF